MYSMNKSLLISAKDSRGRMKISQILSYAQEVADSHAATINISNSELGGSLAWILTRIYLEPSNMVLGSDDLTITTAPCHPGSVVNARECRLHYAGNLVADVVQEWTIIDTATRRIVGGGELNGYREHCLPPTIISPNNRKVRARDVGTMVLHHDELISMNHIDVLGHVNNTYYADFVTSCMTPEEFNCSIAYFNITYIKEALYGETLSIYRAREGNKIVVQGVKADGSASFAAAIMLL